MREEGRERKGGRGEGERDGGGGRKGGGGREEKSREAGRRESVPLCCYGQPLMLQPTSIGLWSVSD